MPLSSGQNDEGERSRTLETFSMDKMSVVQRSLIFETEEYGLDPRSRVKERHIGHLIGFLSCHICVRQVRQRDQTPATRREPTRRGSEAMAKAMLPLGARRFDRGGGSDFGSGGFAPTAALRYTTS